MVFNMNITNARMHQIRRHASERCVVYEIKSSPQKKTKIVTIIIVQSSRSTWGLQLPFRDELKGFKGKLAHCCCCCYFGLSLFHCFGRSAGDVEPRVFFLFPVCLSPLTPLILCRPLCRRKRTIFRIIGWKIPNVFIKITLFSFYFGRVVDGIVGVCPV